MSAHTRRQTAEEAAEELRRQHQDAASVHLDRDETTEDICRELRAAGLDPERMQRRVRELRERIAEERRAR